MLLLNKYPKISFTPKTNVQSSASSIEPLAEQTWRSDIVTTEYEFRLSLKLKICLNCTALI